MTLGKCFLENQYNLFPSYKHTNNRSPTEVNNINFVRQ